MMINMLEDHYEGLGIMSLVLFMLALGITFASLVLGKINNFIMGLLFAILFFLLIKKFFKE